MNNSLRVDLLKMLTKAGSGHTAGSLSILDILNHLYNKEMNITPETALDEGRDRFVLSSAHMAPALYTILSSYKFISKEKLDTLREFGSELQGHTFRNLEIGIETTGGSLGQGLSIASGFALAAKLKQKSYRTYCLISDGEVQEGSIWEAAMFCAQKELDNLCVILDQNGIQQSNYVENITKLDPLADKWESFGWNVIQINGHDEQQINFAFAKARTVKIRPTIIIAKTIAGKGVSFIENKWEWHGKVPTTQELELAIMELENGQI